METIKTPWTDEQVEALTAYQNDGQVHPYTCGKCRAVLLAKTDGWHCPDCDYTQDWALAMAPRSELEQLREENRRLLRGAEVMRIMDKLRLAWLREPNLRFCQLLLGIQSVPLAESSPLQDTFYLADKEFELRVDSWLAQMDKFDEWKASCNEGN